MSTVVPLLAGMGIAVSAVIGSMIVKRRRKARARETIVHNEKVEFMQAFASRLNSTSLHQMFHTRSG